MKQAPLYSLLLLLFFLPFLTGFIEINIGEDNQVNTGTVVTSQSSDCLEGNSKTATEAREVKGFSSLVIAGSAFDLNIVGDQDTSLSLTAAENLLSSIITRVEGEILTIRADRSICSKGPITIDIRTPNLRSVSASGANTLSMEGEYPELDISLDGASELTLTGRGDRLTAGLSGSTTLEAGEFQANAVEIEADGSASATVHAGHSLTARSYGASDITYSGNPAKLDTHTSGAGDISQGE